MVCGTVYIVQAVPRNANLVRVRLTYVRASVSATLRRL
jgi:hypothetical protein